MKLTKQQVHIGAAGFGIIALIFLAASLYVQQARSEFASLSQLKIAQQETKLATIAEVTDNDGADSVVSHIIQDCSLENRARFDDLLGRLSQLQRTELTESKQLFDACGNFYAVRKAAMVARLEREYEIYLDYIELLQTVDTTKPTDALRVQQWGELVAFEKERSTHSTSLVAIQGQLIDALLAGTQVSSPEIQDLLKDAQNAKDLLIYYNTKIDALRQGILDI